MTKTAMCVVTIVKVVYVPDDADDKAVKEEAWYQIHEGGSDPSNEPENTTWSIFTVPGIIGEEGGSEEPVQA
jgi:hypothetical protein